MDAKVLWVVARVLLCSC